MEGIFKSELAAAYFALKLGVELQKKVKLSRGLFGAKGGQVAREES